MAAAAATLAMTAQQLELKLQLVETGTKIMPFSWYQRHAFHTAEPPSSPTFLYWASSFTLIPASCRAPAWYVFLGLMVWFVAEYCAKLLHEHAFEIFLCDLLFKLCTILSVRWPAKEQEHKNNPEYLKKIGCLVPCHKSADEIGSTVASLLKFLEPEHIFVLDNGNSVEPLDNTREVLKELEPRVRYMWIPVGNKTNALWKGLNEMPSSVDFVMHIDDDTELPDNFVFDETIWEDPRVSSTSYAIEMKRTGFVEKCVDWEFRYIAQLRNFESQYSTVWFQHGIIGLWRRADLTRTMLEHPCMFFGEDAWNGIINLMRGKRMLQEMRSSVSTYAPTALTPGCGGAREQGFGAANIWKQRTHRWNVTPPRRLWLRLYLFFAYKGDGLLDSLVFRVLSFHHMASLMFTMITPIGLTMWILKGQWLYLIVFKSRIVGFSLLKNLILNYVTLRHRPDLQADVSTVLAAPFYFMFIGITAVVGNWRSLLSYIPLTPLRFGLYTWGWMNPSTLKTIHGIDSIDDYDDASTSDVSDGSALLSSD